MKVALSGLSVIDWPQLYFASPDEIGRLLKVNEYHLQQATDRDRLMAIHSEAIWYLRSQLQYLLPEQLLKPTDPMKIFLTASRPHGDALQSHACSLLKAMSIVNHVNGRELLYNAPISQRELYALTEDKVERELSALMREGFPILKYEGGRKAKESLITKLLSKRETIAAQIYDRVRYRIVTRTKQDLLALMLRLFDDLLPVNYLIPGASVNQLIRLSEFLTWRERVSRSVHRGTLKTMNFLADLLPFPGTEKEFSGRTYRVVKFVVDIPLRLDRFLASGRNSVYTEALGTLVFVLVEFQIVDEESDRQNQIGRNSHPQYKERQKRGVIRRLLAE